MAKNRINETHIRHIIIDICSFLEIIHSRNIAHLDLRPENILIGNDGKVKICDFGSSIRWELMSNDQTSLLKFIELHTHPLYRAPELLDIYSGVPITCSVDM